MLPTKGMDLRLSHSNLHCSLMNGQKSISRRKKESILAIFVSASERPRLRNALAREVLPSFIYCLHALRYEPTKIMDAYVHC